ncbi:MAG TPA: family 20 glycosylhydrolase [Kiritimatiellia bacterium]|nr:family 20 glycosylhydrolase [Kiritimatiellia bacterium]
MSIGDAGGRLAFRGFHYDIARGTYLRPAAFHEAICHAARCGYTHFLPYLENMIRLPSMERACPPCAYTAEDWGAFQATADAAGIELVPHFNVIGHLEHVVPVYPELGGEAAPGWADMDPTRPAARAWMLRCLEEFCAISQSAFFLIGGDEWQPPKALLEQKGFDAALAWVDHVNAAVEFLVARGRKPIVWHDMLIHYPAALSRLSRDAVIAFWFYDEDSDYPVLSTLREHGFRVLMASGVFSSPCVLTQRGVRAIQTARRAAETHRADGIFVTTWGDCRWEYQRFNMSAIAAVLRGEPPSPLVDALTLFDIRHRMDLDAELARGLDAVRQGGQPELAEALDAERRGDAVRRRELCARHHHPHGPLYSALGESEATPAWTEPPPVHRVSDAPAFGVVEAEDGSYRFFNGDEQFDVWPAYGASLQGWSVAGREVIADRRRALRRALLPPGGYRSYSALGGLRPIWALGTHSNPSILWQYPYAARIVEAGSDSVVAEFTRDFFHVAIRIRVSIERGAPGFRYEVRGINRLARARAAFNFNLPLTLRRADVEGMALRWRAEDGAPRETTIARERVSAFTVPARGPLTVAGTAWTLDIEADPAETALYFVDWGPGFITPDVHGVYRPRDVNEEVNATWRFTCRPV